MRTIVLRPGASVCVCALKRTCARSTMDDHQEALLDNFLSVTGCERERATFYLQASRWDLDVRV